MLSESQRIALKSARDDEVELALRLSRRPWKRARPNVHDAEKPLNETAHGPWLRRKQQSEASEAGGKAGSEGGRGEQCASEVAMLGDAG